MLEFILNSILNLYCFIYDSIEKPCSVRFIDKTGNCMFAWQKGLIHLYIFAHAYPSTHQSAARANILQFSPDLNEGLITNALSG